MTWKLFSEIDGLKNGALFQIPSLQHYYLVLGFEADTIKALRMSLDSCVSEINSIEVEHLCQPLDLNFFQPVPKVAVATIFAEYERRLRLIREYFHDLETNWARLETAVGLMSSAANASKILEVEKP